MTMAVDAIVTAARTPKARRLNSRSDRESTIRKMSAVIISIHSTTMRMSVLDVSLLPMSGCDEDVLLLEELFNDIRSEMSMKQVAGNIARDPASVGNPVVQRALNRMPAKTSVSRAPMRRRQAGDKFFLKKCGMFTKARMCVISDMTTMKQTRL